MDHNEQPANSDVGAAEARARSGARTLQFPSGAARLTIDSGPDPLEQPAATFTGPRPKLTVTDETVAIDYRRPRPSAGSPTRCADLQASSGCRTARRG